MIIARIGFPLRLLAVLSFALVLQGQTTMRGLYWKIPAPASEDEAQRDLANLQSNRYLNGVLISARWNDVEPARDKYDFSSFDRGVAAVRKAGKYYKLQVVLGQYTPAYIFAAGAAHFPTKVTNPNRENYGEGVSIPIPWDPVYQERLSRLIRKLGERYASDPLLVSVALSCANYMGSEMHLPRSNQDVETWKRLGLTSDRLLAVYRKYLDEWEAAFPGRIVCLHMSPITPFSDRTEDEFVGEIARYAIERYPGRFALQRNT